MLTNKLVDGGETCLEELDLCNKSISVISVKSVEVY